MSGWRVLVVVPTYDEVDNLEPILERLHASVPDAHALVVDDGSPDGTGELAEKLAASRLRAVEFGRTVVVAATSGISAIVAPDGSLAASSGLFEPAVFVEEIAQRDATTLAERLGAGPEWLLSALGAGALLAVAAPALRRRARRGAA